MADDDLLIDDDVEEIEDSDSEDEVSNFSRNVKYETRKRLEEYLEEKRLRELIDY